MRLDTSKIVYDNCRPGAKVVSVLEEKAAKDTQRDTAMSSKLLVGGGDLDTSQMEFHKYACFYPPALLNRSEFVF